MLRAFQKAKTVCLCLGTEMGRYLSKPFKRRLFAIQFACRFHFGVLWGQVTGVYDFLLTWKSKMLQKETPVGHHFKSKLK